MNLLQRWFYLFAALFGIGFIIFFHELGHFLMCKLFNITTPVFSIGFGPPLIKFEIGQTTFQLSALPLGGYVSMNPKELLESSYIVKMLIASAGIVFNFILSFIIVQLIKLKGNKTITSSPTWLFSGQRRGQLAGIVGIVHMLQRSLATDPRLYFLTIAQISTSIGIFNLLPIPALDGGKMLAYTLQFMNSGTEFGQSLGIIETLLLIVFITFTLFIAFKDVKNLKK